MFFFFNLVIFFIKYEEYFGRYKLWDFDILVLIDCFVSFVL